MRYSNKSEFVEVIVRYLSAIIYTLVAWIDGLFLDDIGDPAGFFPFRILLPILAMGFCILKSINDKGNKTN